MVKKIGNNFIMKEMKKIFFVAIAMVCAAFIGCTKYEAPSVNNDDIKFVFSILEKPTLGTETRAVKTDWENGDQILIVFKSADPNTIVGKNTVLLTYDGSAWTAEKSADFDATTFHSTKQFSAHYHRGGIGFLETILAENYKGGELYYAIECPYTQDGSNFNLGTINMKPYCEDVIFQVSIPGLDEDYRWDLSVTDQSGKDIAWYLGGATMKISTVNTYPGFTADGQAAQSSSWGCKVGDDHIFWFELREDRASSATEYNFNLHSNGGYNETYTVVKDATHTLEAKKAYKLPAITDAK